MRSRARCADSEDAEFWFVDAYNRRHFHCTSCTDFQDSRRALDEVVQRPAEWRQALSARARARPAGKTLVVHWPASSTASAELQVSYVPTPELPR